MGGVSAAAGQGAEAVFLNPASLSRVSAEAPSEVSLGYDALLESAYSGSAVYARPLGGEGALAAGLLYASQSAQTKYDALGDAAGKFAPTDLALGAWYARRFRDSIGLAGGLKIIRSALDDQSGTTVAADFGVVARHIADIGEGPFDVGVAVLNIGPPLKLGSVADPLPARFRAGGVWHMSPNFDGGFDVNLPVDQDPYAAFGVEAHVPVLKTDSASPWVVSVRGGYDASRTRDVDGLTGLSAGAGFDFASLRLDYAWIPFGDLGTVNRVTIAFRF